MMPSTPISSWKSSSCFWTCNDGHYRPSVGESSPWHSFDHVIVFCRNVFFPVGKRITLELHSHTGLTQNTLPPCNDHSQKNPAEFLKLISLAIDVNSCSSEGPVVGAAVGEEFAVLLSPPMTPPNRVTRSCRPDVSSSILLASYSPPRFQMSFPS